MSTLKPELVDPTSLPIRVLRLRWRFEYSDGKVARNGIWDGVSSAPVDSAWAVDKTNLARVLIQGEDRLINVGAMCVLIEVPGQEYASMQWEAYSKLPAFFSAQAVTPSGVVAGLSIITSKEKITASVDGRVTREPLSDYQASFDIHEHKLGT